MSEPKDQLSDHNDQDSSTVSIAGYHQFIIDMNCLNRRIIKNLCYTIIYCIGILWKDIVIYYRSSLSPSKIPEGVQLTNIH